MPFLSRKFGFFSLAVLVAILVGLSAAQKGGRAAPMSRSCTSLLSPTDFQFSVVEAHSADGRS